MKNWTFSGSTIYAPYAPALLGVSGALGSAALAGGAMFGSMTLTTGATSFATNGTFSPNLKAAGISAGITALFAGIEGGIRATNNERNFWTGEKIEKWQPTPVARLRMQTPKFKTELKFKTTLSKIKSLRSGSSLQMDADNLYLYDNYFDGSCKLRDVIPVRSGGRNPLPSNVKYGRIPNGNFVVDNLRLRQLNQQTIGMFTNDGFGFSLDLTPKFYTTREFFRIHFDNSCFYGTQGCIGIINPEDAYRFYNSMQTYFSRYNQQLQLWVNY